MARVYVGNLTAVSVAPEDVMFALARAASTGSFHGGAWYYTRDEGEASAPIGALVSFDRSGDGSRGESAQLADELLGALRALFKATNPFIDVEVVASDLCPWRKGLRRRLGKPQTAADE